MKGYNEGVCDMKFTKRIVTSVVMLIISILLNGVSGYAASYEYDELGRLVTATYGEEEGNEDEANYTYDAGGNITNVSGFKNETSSEKSRIWNLSSDVYRLLGTINQNISLSGLNMYVTASSDMIVENRSKELNGVIYEYALNTKGAGSKNSRSVSINAEQNSDIYVAVKSSNSGARTLILENSGGIVDSVNIDGTLEIYKFEYTSDTDDIHIYATGGAIHLYEISARKHTEQAEPIDRIWNFSDDIFSVVGTSALTSPITVDGLTVTEKASRDSGIAVVDGVMYTKYISLSSKGNATENSIGFEVNKNAKIYVTVAANSERVLLLTNEYGYVLDEVTIGAVAAAYELNYTGNGDKLFIRTKSSGARVYSVSVETERPTYPPTRSWSFSSNDFNKLGLITEDITIDGLTINSSGAKAVEVKSSYTLVNGFIYNYKLKLGGMGSRDDVSIKFGAESKSDIYITAKAGAAAVRPLIIANSSEVLSQIDVTEEWKVYKYTYTGNTDDIYLQW